MIIGWMFAVNAVKSLIMILWLLSFKLKKNKKISLPKKIYGDNVRKYLFDKHLGKQTLTKYDNVFEDIVFVI